MFRSLLTALTFTISVPAYAFSVPTHALTAEEIIDKAGDVQRVDNGIQQMHMVSLPIFRLALQLLLPKIPLDVLKLYFHHQEMSVSSE